jgi:hypothetical protein
LSEETQLVMHSPIGASSYYRWKACPGSVRLSRGIEKKSSSYAEEGTLAHTVAAHFLLHKEWLPEATPEMKEALEVYIDSIEKLEQGECIQLVEHRFDLSSLFKNLFGTGDCVQYFPQVQLLRVTDLKYGAGIPVEAEENLQLMYYALGAILSLKFPALEVEVVIVQPRCFHPDGPVRRWKFPVHRLLDFASELVEDAKATEAENAPLIPGDHCRFCPANGICPAIHKKAQELAKVEFSKEVTYDPLKLSQALSWLPALEGWITQVREFAYREACRGAEIPGFKLVQKRATRRWKDPDSAAGTLQALFGLMEDHIYTKNLKSPAQVEKVLSKKDKKLLEGFILSESSGFTLAPQDDPREPVRNDAKSDFAPDVVLISDIGVNDLHE